MRTFLPVFAVMSAAMAFFAAPAAAQIRGVRPEGHLNLTRGVDLGLGARLDIPIVPQGFIDSTNDELAISPGIDFLIGDNHSWVAVPVVMQWNFYLEREWSIFPELGLAFLFGKHHKKGNDSLALDLAIAFGGRYHFNDRNSLVMRLGWPIFLQFGMTF